MFPHLYLVYSLKRPHLRPCWAELLRSSTFWGVWAARSDHCLTSLLVTVGRWSLGSGTPAQLDHGRATDSFPGKAEQGWRKSDWVPESVFRAFPDPTLQLIPLLLKRLWKTGKQNGEEEAGEERGIILTILGPRTVPRLSSPALGLHLLLINLLFNFHLILQYVSYNLPPR